MGKDTDYFTSNFIEFYPQICRYIFSVTGCMDRSEDLTQEVFCRFFISMGKFDIKKSRAWLFGAARNIMKEEFRRNLPLPIEEESMELLSCEKEICGRGDAELKIIVKEALNSLSMLDRILLEHASLSGDTYEETAQSMGLTRDQVKYRYMKIRRELKLYF